jgi:hypothetical protein
MQMATQIKTQRQLEARDSTGEWRQDQIRFLKTETCRFVSEYVLLSIDRAMEQAGVKSRSNHQNRAQVFIAKALSKLGLVWNVRRFSFDPVFVAFMGFSESRTIPFSYWTEIFPYCFDCWPKEYERWTSFFKRHRIRLAFFTARQSAQHFAAEFPEMQVVWLPEATDPADYWASKSLPDRDIDVLELGRKYDRFHFKIADSLAGAGRRHLFEKVKGEIIFPDRARLIEGMGNSKISICFPCSQTHPARSGSVETVTHRYFESMASKCLIVGHAPQELTDLFGYNPVIEVRWGSEFEQIESVLDNLGSFQDLVERNYRRLLEVGTWKSRVAKILDTLRAQRI